MGHQEEHAGIVSDEPPLTHPQAVAVHRAKALQPLPLVPKRMPMQRRFLWSGAVLIVLSLPACAMVGSSKPWADSLSAASTVVLLCGFGALALSRPVGRMEARRLVVPRKGLVCPTCHYPLDAIDGQGLCPECATYFDPSAVISLWRGSYGLRRYIANPDLVDLHEMLESARQARGAKNSARPTASDAPHE